jgi:hypothetical protein
MSRLVIALSAGKTNFPQQSMLVGIGDQCLAVPEKGRKVGRFAAGATTGSSRFPYPKDGKGPIHEQLERHVQPIAHIELCVQNPNNKTLPRTAAYSNLS